MKFTTRFVLGDDLTAIQQRNVGEIVNSAVENLFEEVDHLLAIKRGYHLMRKRKGLH